MRIRDENTRPPGASAGWLGRHWLFLLLLAAGVTLRAVTLLAYRPALFSPDSRLYLFAAAELEPTITRPFGYGLFLRLLPFDLGPLELGPLGTLHLGYAVIPLAQHLLGVAMAVLLYATLVHLGVPGWISALATAPVLLDAYQLNIEQYVLSETFFDFLLVTACVVLLWRGRVGTVAAGVAGLLLAVATLTRGIGIVTFAPALLAVLFLRGRRFALGPVVAFPLLFALPLVAYMAWFHSLHDRYAMTGVEGRFLYGRVVRFADCSRFVVPSEQRVLCPRPTDANRWMHELLWSDSPVDEVDPPPGMTRNEVAGAFAWRAIVHQPGAYARAVGADFVRSFAPVKRGREYEFQVSQWEFQRSFPIPGHSPRWSVSAPPPYADSAPPGTVDERLAEFLRSYQHFGYTPGPVLAAGLAVAALATFGVGRARTSGLRSATFLIAAVPLALHVGTAALSTFSWRYQLPQIVFVPAAAALGVTALTGMRRAVGRDLPHSGAEAARQTASRDVPVRPPPPPAYGGDHRHV